MGNPRLLQKLPNIAALLSQRGGDGEQSAPAGGALVGLGAMADLPLNHRLAQGTLGGVVGGFDTFDRQERPEAIGHGEQLIAGANHFGPRRSLAALMAQRHNRRSAASKDWRIGSQACCRVGQSIAPSLCGASGQTTATAYPAAPPRIRHWRTGVRRWR